MASRHRSNTSTSAHTTQRPDSRASTMSATSQNDNGHALSGAHATAKPGQPANVNMDPEATLLHYQQSMGHQAMPQYDMSQHQNNGLQHAQHVQYPMQGGYMGPEQQYWSHEVGPAGHMPMGSVPYGALELQDDRRKKGSSVTATNDRELREMLAKNEGRQLKEVAQEVIQKERTPLAEKTKQLFAMLWLRAVCKPARTSVPRNRVYSQYASRCGTERVVPLNPASFGKLVRVIFPGIQTRRLGVRGESKYHYVDLALEEDLPSAQPQWPSQGFQQEPRARSQSIATPHLDFNTAPPPQADATSFPPADGAFDTPPIIPITPRGPPSKSQAFAYPATRGMQPNTAETLTYSQVLRFPSSHVPAFSENEPVTLPAIGPYLPPRTDPDTAEALCALYRTHCTSLIDSIRFCKEKQFFRLYTSFLGTLTVPVQKLFTHPNLAAWIEQCDLTMYRTMIRFVSRLTLQAAPVVVINILSNISASLHGHIAKTFSTQPAHVLEGKLRPATVFASLLHRLIRVNQSAHAAANLLTIDQNREQMWREWVQMVNPKRVMEAELPNCGYDEVYKILTSEMRGLLEPLQAPPYMDDPYDFSAYPFEENGSFAQFLQNHTGPPTARTDGASAVSTENVLDRWSAFITSLPGRFPHASTRTLLHCISAVGTAALRDITITNGLSYGHWWVLKIFVDEMSLWMAEMGGFLEDSQLDSFSANGGDNSFHQSPVLVNTDGINANGGNQVNHNSNNMSAESNMNNGSATELQSNPNIMSATHGYQASHQMGFHPQQYPAVQPQQQHQQHQHQQQPAQSKLRQAQPHPETDIDDSGIGMSLMDDDMSGLGKFGSVEALGSTQLRVDAI